MEKILEALVDEITTRVLAKMEANVNGAYDFLKLKVKAENIEGLRVEHIDGLSKQIDDAVDASVSLAVGEAMGDEMRKLAEEAAAGIVENASYEISVRT